MSLDPREGALTVGALKRILEAFEDDTEVWVGRSGGAGKRFTVEYANDVRPPGHFGSSDGFLAIMHTEEKEEVSHG